ncbi:MAG: NAD-dependent epimerase/dehydratase family protein [Flavobacteriales bacterium]|nr:NAD-dependent epimerase/dehydratase family protein [Flavobacteriales bacterium]
MKILITGGAGFVGSHVAEALLEKGHEILVIDNYATGNRSNLPDHNNLKVVEGTIADTKLVEDCFANFKPNIVVHAAAAYKDPENWLEDAFSNVVGTVNIAKSAKNHNVNRIVYFQTSLCYGLTPLEQPITLNHPLFSAKSEGGSSYAISKTGGEQYIELSGIDFISFRLANAYGPRNLSGPLPTFYHRLTREKPCFVMDTRRDFIFIEDLVEIVVLAVEGKGKKGYYHVSSGSDYSIKELFDATVSALGITLDNEVEVRPRGEDDVYTILLDPSVTAEAFGWKIKTPLQEGIDKAIAWYKSNDIQETYTHLKQVESE